MVNPYLGGLNLPWTQRWCRLSTVTAHHILGLPMWEPCWLQPEGGRRGRTQNSQGLAAGPVWSFLQERLGRTWSEETRRFLSLLAKAKARSEPPIMKKRAEQAWRLRWVRPRMPSPSPRRRHTSSTLDKLHRLTRVNLPPWRTWPSWWNFPTNTVTGPFRDGCALHWDRARFRHNANCRRQLLLDFSC